MSEISIPCTGVSFQSISAKARPFPSALLGVERHEQKEVAWYRLLVLISSAVFGVQPDDQINCQSETTNTSTITDKCQSVPAMGC